VTPTHPAPESESGVPSGPGSFRYQRLGEILIARQKIEAEDLERALELQKERGDKLGKILVDMGLIAQRDVLAALSDQLGIALVTVDGPPPVAPEIEGLTDRFLRHCRAFPIALADSTLTLAMADPLDFETVAARNPRLVYGLITGYGERGPDADRAAYDVAAFWARAGLAHLLTRPGESPPFQRGGMGDHSAGMTLAAAVCAFMVTPICTYCL